MQDVDSGLGERTWGGFLIKMRFFPIFAFKKYYIQPFLYVWIEYKLAHKPFS